MMYRRILQSPLGSAIKSFRSRFAFQARAEQTQ
jgi:hypothetical protein